MNFVLIVVVKIMFRITSSDIINNVVMVNILAGCLSPFDDHLQLHTNDILCSAGGVIVLKSYKIKILTTYDHK
jgi:hypothetical protein